MKRILSLALVLLMMVSIIPLRTFAESETGQPECDQNCNVDVVSAHAETCAVKIYYRDLYTNSTAQELYDIWQSLSADAQSYILDTVSWNVDQTKRAELVQLLESGSSTDPSTSTDPTDPPVAPEVPKLDDEESGVVLKGTFPTDVSLSVEPADVSGQLSQFGVSGEKLVFGLDISLMRSGADYQPGAAVRVKVPVSAAAGTKIGILHTHGGNTTYMGLTEVLSDGTVEFTTDRFSTFAGFTVDFHYNEIDYSIGGLTSIKLSELFVALEINRNAAHVIDVTYSDPSQIEVTQIDGDWQLESLKAFDTEETLEITFYDGEIITIKVTDKLNPSENIWSYTNDKGQTIYIATVSTNGSVTNKGQFYLYDADTPNDQNRTQYKHNEAYLKQAGNTWSYLSTNEAGRGSYWFYGSASDATIDVDGDHSFKVQARDWKVSDGLANANKIGNIYVERIPNLIIESKAPYHYTISQKRYVAVGNGVEERKVEVYINDNTKPHSSTPKLFPNRGSDKAKSQLDIYYIRPKNFYFWNLRTNEECSGRDEHGYYLATSGDFYEYDDTNNIYKLKLKTRFYIQYDGNGANIGSMDGEQAFIYGDGGDNLWTNDFDKNYDVTFDANGSTLSPAYITNEDGTKTTTVTKLADFRFDGWSGSDGKNYSNDEHIKDLTEDPGGVITMSVKWSGGSVQLPTPTRTGYSFDGWYTDKTGGTKIIDSTYTPTADDTTLYAHWSANNYTVNFDYNGGTGSSDTSHPVTYGSTDYSKVHWLNPAREGYVFDGWYDAQSGGTKVYYGANDKDANGNSLSGYCVPNGSAYWDANSCWKGTEDLTLFAHWIPIYKVTLDNQSANTPGTTAYWFIHNTVNNGVYYYTDANCTTALANYTITKPTRTGYIFGGYYTGTNGQGTQYVNADGVCINNLYKKEGNETLFAKWTPITYTVTYDGNPSHDGTTANSTHIYDDEKALTPNGYQRSWYKFVGWNTMTDGSGDSYADQASVKNLTDENGATVTLYAQWKPIYKITLDSQEQTEGTPNFYFVHTLDAYYSEETCTTALNDNKIVLPTKAGYTFAGYYTEPGGKGTQYIDASGKISSACCQLGQDTKLYAKWDIITYTITYQFEDDVTPDEKVSYNYETDVKLIVPAREGYKFLGWTNLSRDQYLVTHNWEYTNYDNASDGMQNPGDNQWGNVKLKARWQEQYRYVLSFNSNGGSAVEPITKEWCDDAEWTFTWDQTKNPTRTGYTFMGWATEANSNDVVIGPDSNSYKITGTPTETETKTLYAIWQRNTGTVVLDYTGDDAPVIVTVECTTSEGGVNSEKIRIQTVITGDITLSNLPTGTYSVTAEPGRGNYTASANPGSVTIGKGESKTVTVTTGAKGNNWLTGFARAINRCS